MTPINRRKFIKSSLAAGSLTLAGVQVLPKILNAKILSGDPDIVTISGDDPVSNIKKLLEPFGGIERFVKPGSSVGFLLNSPWQHPGTFTNAAVALSAIQLCLDAGAGDIVCFVKASADYWNKSSKIEGAVQILDQVKYSDERTEVEISNGVTLKKANVYKDFLEVDVFINIPVAKHHAGTNYSGTLKNLMGVSSSKTNRFMHSPDGEYTYDKQEYLAQCIVDLALVRKPDLCIIDLIECILNNGPRGPGETIKPNKIIAGTDPLAMDIYAASLIGFTTDDVLTFEKARQHGLGEIDTEKLNIMEI